MKSAATHIIPPVWIRASENSEPIESLGRLPTYGAVFFLRNMGGFRLPFLLLTLVSISGAVIGFLAVYLVSSLIDNAASLTAARLLSFYLPGFFLLIAGKELLEFYVRKYGEAFSTIYCDQLQLRFLLSLVRLRFSALTNIPPQRLLTLVGRYISNVKFFIEDWFWGSSRKLTQLCITAVILYEQSPMVLAANLLFFSLFLGISFRLSAKLSPLVEAQAQEEIEYGTVVGSFSYHLETVRRLGIESFFISIYRAALLKKWSAFTRVRSFHARRWLLQLVLFDCGYYATLLFGAYQVALGQLPIGYLVLIKYAFDTSSQALIHVIEYYVSLVQQREDGAIMRTEFAGLDEKSAPQNGAALNGWSELSLAGARATYNPKSQGGAAAVSIEVPELRVRRGEKIGIVGPSGAGKSTILNMLLNLCEFDGRYRADDRDIKGRALTSQDAVLINNTDPLFALPLRDNLLLGREVEQGELDRVLRLVQAESFSTDLNAKVGDPRFNLSSGQRQRIRIARGLLTGAELYLMDEPFNGIDDDTKSRILTALRGSLAGKTVILVTHNEDELSLVDTIYTLRDGRLIKR